MSWSEKYKNANKTVEGLFLLTSSVVDVVINRMGSDVKHINSLISSSNIEALKKRHPVMLDEIREFTALMSSLNNMAANTARIEYLRKSIATQASGSSKSDKKREYIKGKTEKLENHISDFAASIKVCRASLKFFAPTSDTQSKPTKDISSLQDLVSILDKGIAKLDEQTIKDVRSASKELLSDIESSSKSGGSDGGDGGDGSESVSQIDEYLKELNKSATPTTGGTGTGAGTSEIVCGGTAVVTSESRVSGGYDSRSAKSRMMQMDLKQGSFGLDRDRQRYMSEIVEPSIKKMYPGVSLEDLAQMSAEDIMSYLRKVNKIWHPVLEVIKLDHISQWQPSLLSYLQKHSQKYLNREPDTSSVPAMSDNDDVLSQLQNICDVSKSVDQILADIDREIIISYVSEAAERANLCTSVDQVRSVVKKYKSIYKPGEVLPRTAIKKTIRQCTSELCQIVADLQQLQDQNDKSVVVVDTSAARDNMQAMEKVMRIEKATVPLLMKEEDLWKRAASVLNTLIESWLHLISPHVVDTCINPVKSKIGMIVVLSMFSAMFQDGGRFAESQEDRKDGKDGKDRKLMEDIKQVSEGYLLYKPGQGLDNDALEKIIQEKI